MRRAGTALALVATVAVAAAVLLLTLGADDERVDTAGAGGRARNVIVFVGDGMGAAHRELIRLATVGREGRLAMDGLPHAAMVFTDPADPETLVTDSAAAGTALATGVRTSNGRVGVDPAGERLTTVLERARRAGKAAGLVTTSRVTDATPAAFGAHTDDRADEGEIARQYLEDSKPDVILGGGEDWWLPPGEPGAVPGGGDRAEAGGEDLIRRAEQLGYDHVSDAQQLRSSRSARILGLFANGQMYESGSEGANEGEAAYDPAVSLEAMTSSALRALSRDGDGFLLLVEEEAIDGMSHANNAAPMIDAGRALDRAVGVGVGFAAEHRDTLVVVTGDHETGGLAVHGDLDGSSPEDDRLPVARSELEVIADWTTTQHTNVPVPLTALGPGAQRLSGVLTLPQVHDAIAAALDLPSPSP